MNTPIYDFVNDYSNSNFSRLHMPGHKGKNYLGCEYADITEIKDADALFDAKGIIAESEKNATELFGTLQTIYSAEGSTLCIKTMLALVRKYKKNNYIIASRNSHKALIYGCSQLNMDIQWLWGDDDVFSLCRCKISEKTLYEKLNECDELPCAVYVTSPDYLGGEIDIKSLAETAHKFGVPLLVDNAHGSYLHFFSDKRHPIDLGVDMCCDSAHKTLPVLTGGAYLHINNKEYVDKAKNAMEMFASTSPSYLILQSLDICNSYIADGYKDKLHKCVEMVDKLKSYLADLGWKIEQSDPLKLTIMSYGLNLAEYLRKYNIECEYEDPDYTVMMFTPENSIDDFEKVKCAMKDCKPVNAFSELKNVQPERIMTVTEAIFSPYEMVPVEKAVGRICASPSVGCPPAVPIVVAGEVISEKSVEIFKYYNVDSCLVVK